MKGVAMINFLTANWLWIVFVVAMLAMHRHGGCGMHGHHHKNGSDPTEPIHAHHNGQERTTP
jgi:hypothetical protein